MAISKRKQLRIFLWNRRKQLSTFAWVIGLGLVVTGLASLNWSEEIQLCRLTWEMTKHNWGSIVLIVVGALLVAFTNLRSRENNIWRS